MLTSTAGPDHGHSPAQMAKFLIKSMKNFVNNRPLEPPQSQAQQR
jgi:hypothetical protein